MERLRVFTAFSGYDSQCMALEEWRDIKGFEGEYQVSNRGRVRSLPRESCVQRANGTVYSRKIKGKVLSPKWDKDAYLLVQLGKDYTKKVHRLVAEAFCEGYKEGLQVNHKDENKHNNNADNLEWCTAKYNNNYGTHLLRMAEKHCKKVAQKTLQGVEVRLFASLKEAERYIGVKGASTPICRCCKGKNKSAYGYKWEYAL